MTFQLERPLRHIDFVMGNIIAPSPGYSGVKGSGFGAPYQAVPVDPARVTAKPALRLITPPRQTILDQVLVGVAAWANDGGLMMSNCGLQKVRFHYEGRVLDIARPTFQTLTDANGNKRTYLGWWCWLQHNGVHGETELYVEAVPRDATMQNRVMGPYRFLPSATKYDYEVEVAPSQPQVAGQRYTSMVNAMTYLKGVASQRGHITVTEAGLYDMAQVTGGYTGSAGYCTIEATVPITFGYPSFLGDVASQMRPKYDGLRFRGSNITFDFKNMGEVRQEDVTSIYHWFDGIKFIVSGAGRAELWRKGRRPTAWAVRKPAWFTECDISGVSNPCFDAWLTRGCNFHEGHNDCVSEGRCVIGNVTNDWDSVAAGLHVDVPALDVIYTGAEATASLQLSGNGSDGATRTFTARYGANAPTFTVQSSEAAYNAGTNYDVADVAAWLNGLPGWSAVVLDDSRRATALSLPGLKGVNFAATNCKDTTLRLVTEFDSHTDWYAQINPGNAKENVIIQDNLVLNFRGQGLFLAGDDGAKDYIVVNNAWFHKLSEDGYAANSQTASQFNWGHSHVVVAQCSWASQKFNFKTDAGYNGDSYCLVTNSTAPLITWVGAVDADVKVKDNHLQDGGVAPTGSSGTTIGGTVASLFANPAAGDFTPLGALLANPKPAAVRYDQGKVLRAALAPAGARA